MRLPISLDTIQAIILHQGPLGPLVVIGLYVLDSFLPIPPEILTVAIAVVYGPLWGTILAWAAAMAAAFAAFAVARFGGRPLVLRFVKKVHLEKFDAWAEDNGAIPLLILRLIPFVSFHLLNFAAGLTNFSWWTFAWTTGLGMLPMTILLVSSADQLRQGHPLGLWLLAPVILLTLAALFLKRRRKND